MFLQIKNAIEFKTFSLSNEINQDTLFIPHRSLQVLIVCGSVIQINQMPQSGPEIRIFV